MHMLRNNINYMQLSSLQTANLTHTQPGKFINLYNSSCMLIVSLRRNIHILFKTLFQLHFKRWWQKGYFNNIGKSNLVYLVDLLIINSHIK